MSLVIRPADPRESEARRLLEASHALMRSLYTKDECHFLEIDALCVPSIRFFLAELDGHAAGCGAVALKEGYGELKSMFVDPEARGRGVAGALVARLEQEARAAGQGWLKLETGDVLHAAHRVYERSGFRKCAPFGDYVEHPASLYYEKPLH